MAKAEFCVPLMSSLRAPSTAFDLARSPQYKIVLGTLMTQFKVPCLCPQNEFRF